MYYDSSFKVYFRYICMIFSQTASEDVEVDEVVYFARLRVGMFEVEIVVRYESGD